MYLEDLIERLFGIFNWKVYLEEYVEDYLEDYLQDIFERYNWELVATNIEECIDKYTGWPVQF